MPAERPLWSQGQVIKLYKTEKNGCLDKGNKERIKNALILALEM